MVLALWCFEKVSAKNYSFPRFFLSEIVDLFLFSDGFVIELRPMHTT